MPLPPQRARLAMGSLAAICVVSCSSGEGSDKPATGEAMGQAPTSSGAGGATALAATSDGATSADGLGGNSTGEGSTSSDGTSLLETPCTFSITESMSEVIPTVGIVEFSVDLPSLDGASIEFGLDTNYGMTAPVDLARPNHRTVLLGMKTNREYHYRIVAASSDTQCASDDQTLVTSPPPNGLVVPDVQTPLPDQRWGGYLVTARWGPDTNGPALIFDEDYDLVWWYTALDDIIRARFSYDGTHMWLRNTAQEEGLGVVLRVSLDGLEEERWELPSTTHDLAVLPNGNLALAAHADNGCDEILEFDPETGETTTLFNLVEAHGQTRCLANYLAYSALDDSFYVSDRTQSTYVKISRTGEFVWSLNGTGATISGTNWIRQHGSHVIEPDHLLVFSNGSGRRQPSLALEYRIDQSSGTASELWRYDGNLQIEYGGDVQRLDNGNTLVTYSQAGVIHEVNPAGELVEAASFALGTSVSYAIKRRSLYGAPPPKIHGL